MEPDPDLEPIEAIYDALDRQQPEKALRIADAGDAEVTLLSMGPPAAAEALRKGLAMGAHRAVVIADLALAGATPSRGGPAESAQSRAIRPKRPPDYTSRRGRRADPG